MIKANASFASKPSISVKNYDCGFCALNIMQVDTFWYLTTIMCLIPYSTTVSPEPLITVSQKMAANAGVRSGSSLRFTLGLSGDYWNLMASFSMKVHFRSRNKKVGGEGKYVEGRTSEPSQGSQRELFLVRELPALLIFTVNLTVFFFPCSPCCSDQENECKALPSFTYVWSGNEGRVSLICLCTWKYVYL